MSGDVVVDLATRRLSCGHHASLLVKSVESPRQFCELCEERSMRADAVKMETEYRIQSDALAGALALLVARLGAVHDAPEYRAVWECAQLHRGQYKGPTYTAEYDAARAALAKAGGK